MAKTRVDLITKSLREYAHTLEFSYYSACITYNVGKKVIVCLTSYKDGIQFFGRK